MNEQETVLREVREFITTVSEDGWSSSTYFYRRELLAKIDAALAAPQPVGYISEDTLAKLRDPEWQALRNEPATLWTANNPPTRAVVPVYVAAPAATVQSKAEEPLERSHDPRHIGPSTKQSGE